MTVMASKTGPHGARDRRVDAGVAGKKEKARGRPFAKGVSGNPAGRPFGSRNKATMLALQLLEGEAEALTRKAVERALEGETTALRLCLERLIPPRKGRPIGLDLPAVTSTKDLATGFAALMAALARGDLTPDEAQAVATLLEQHRRVLETADLEQRVSALEERWLDESERAD